MAQKALVSAKGRAVYPRLQKPDTKYKTEYGEFKVKIRTEKADTVEYKKAQEQVKTIKALMAETLKDAKAKADPKKAKKLKLTSDVPFGIDDDGAIELLYRTSGGGKDPETKETWTRKLPLFGKNGKPLVVDSDVIIGSGSELRASYVLKPWVSAKNEVGVKLQLVAAQILEVQEYEADGTRYGFENEGEDDEDEGSEDNEFPGTEDGDDDEDEGEDTAEEDDDDDEDAEDF